MANTYPAAGSLRLVDPQVFATGAVLRGDAGGALDFARLSNYLIGNMGRSTVGQAWPDGHLQHTSNNTFQEALRYKVPTPPGVTSMTVRLTAGASGAAAANDGEIRVTSTTGGGSLTMTIDSVAATSYFTGTLTVAADADGMDEMVVELKGGTTASATVTLTSIGFEPEIDASPLPTSGKVGDATPLGTSKIFAADDAAPAWLYQALAANVEALRDNYPRAVGIWSAGNSALSGASVNHTMLPQLFRWFTFGRLPAGGEAFASEAMTVHARMAGVAAATELRVNRLPDLLTPEDIMPAEGAASTSTPAGVAASAWKRAAVAAVALQDGPGAVEVLTAEFDLSKGNAPQVDSLTVMA